MKDFFDLWILSRHAAFDGDILRKAIRATFDRRGSALPPNLPFGLTDAFAQDAQKQIQGKAFLNKNKIETLGLEEVLDALRTFLQPAIVAANTGTPLQRHWPAGGPWSPIGV